MLPRSVKVLKLQRKTIFSKALSIRDTALIPHLLRGKALKKVHVDCYVGESADVDDFEPEDELPSAERYAHLVQAFEQAGVELTFDRDYGQD